jgi:hypothetical protein
VCLSMLVFPGGSGGVWFGGVELWCRGIGTRQSPRMVCSGQLMVVTRNFSVHTSTLEYLIAHSTYAGGTHSFPLAGT